MLNILSLRQKADSVWLFPQKLFNYIFQHHHKFYHLLNRLLSRAMEMKLLTWELGSRGLNRCHGNSDNVYCVDVVSSRCFVTVTLNPAQVGRRKMIQKHHVIRRWKAAHVIIRRHDHMRRTCWIPKLDKRVFWILEQKTTKKVKKKWILLTLKCSFLCVL